MVVYSSLNRHNFGVQDIFSGSIGEMNGPGNGPFMFFGSLYLKKPKKIARGPWISMVRGWIFFQALRLQGAKKRTQVGVSFFEDTNGLY